MAYMSESTIYTNNNPRDARHVGQKTRAEWVLAPSWNPRIRQMCGLCHTYRQQ